MRLVRVDETDRLAQAARARSLRAEFAEHGVAVVALTFVDNSGITRVKAVPLGKLEHAAAWGIGVSPVFDAFLFNDAIVTGEHAPGAVGDLRLHPDLDRLTTLAAQPGWAWAPADRYDQDGVPHPLDQRTAAKRAVAALAEHGYTAKVAIEVEWVIGFPHGPFGFTPAVDGPAYGHARVAQRSDYVRDVVTALAEEGIEVDQIHPEYAAGQFEVSVAASDPVSAADTYVLVRETIRAVTVRHGFRASFSPKVLAGGVGNGGHIHLSLWRDGQNLCSGGDGPFGLTAPAVGFTAGILAHLPALLAVGAPSMASYLRLIPQHWAGAFAVWGLENREAAVRLVTGAVGSRSWAANVEVKCFDQAANPYLAIAALLYAGLNGIASGAVLPEPLDVDPALLRGVDRDRKGIRPLPHTLAEAVAAFTADTVLWSAFGEALASTIVDVRRGEIAHFDGATPERIAAELRWVH